MILKVVKNRIMKTSEEVKTEFEKELKALLKKYEAEIEINDNSSFSGCNPVMEVWIPERLKDGDCIVEGTEISLGHWYGN